jgi:hypothetical protein
LCTSLDVDKFSISGNEIFSRSQLKLSVSKFL